MALCLLKGNMIMLSEIAGAICMSEHFLRK